MNEPEISPAPVFRREPELQTVLVPEEEPFIGDGKTIIQPVAPAVVSEPERRPEPEPPVSIPSVRRDDHELEEELVPVRPVPSVPDVEETFPEPAPAAQELGADAEQELDPVPDIKELEEGTPPECRLMHACRQKTYPRRLP